MAPFDNELYGYGTDFQFLPEGSDAYGGISDGGGRVSQYSSRVDVHKDVGIGGQSIFPEMKCFYFRIPIVTPTTTLVPDVRECLGWNTIGVRALD